MYETIGLIALFALMGIFLLKLYNLSQSAEKFNAFVIFAGFILSLIFWYLFLASFASSLALETTIDTGSKTLLITDNLYVAYLQFQQVANILFILNTVLSILEVMLLYRNLFITPRAAKFAKRQV